MIPTLTFEPREGAIVVDLDRLLVSRLVISASSGGGKSWALRYLLEQTQKRIQQFVIDTDGEFASLRERHPYLLVGRQGEIPAVAGQAHLLVRRLMALGSSAVLDLSDMPLSDRHEFVSGFARGLVDLPQAEWRSVLVALDEAHLFAPENGRGESVALPAVSDLANLGRKRGQCLVIASQRIANIHNNVLAAMQNKLIGLTTLDTDVRRAALDLGFSTRDQRHSLKQLEPGEFYALGPAICREPTPVRTGQVQTTHPRPGAVMPPAPPAPKAIRALAAQLQDLQTAAAADLDLEGARARIVELERERAAQVPVQAKADHSECRREIESLNVVLREIEDRHGHLLSRHGHVLRELDQLRTTLRELASSVDALMPENEPRQRSRVVDTSLVPTEPVAAETPSTNGHMKEKPKPVGERIIAEIAALESLGVLDPAKLLVALGTGYGHERSTGFVKALGQLRGDGLVEFRPGSKLALTEAGRERARAMGAKRKYDSRAELHAAWLERVGGIKATLLRHLISAHPNPLPRARLAELTGYNHLRSTGFVKAMGQLRSMGVVKYPDGEHAVATDLLFPTTVGVPKP